jgi:hypothetical protein
MANLEILAIDAPEVTRREEYISRTEGPRNWRLFSIVGTIMGNKYIFGDTTIAFLTPGSVCLARPWTEVALFKHSLCACHIVIIIGLAKEW